MMILLHFVLVIKNQCSFSPDENVLYVEIFLFYNVMLHRQPPVQVWQGPQNLVHPLNYARFQLADIYPQLEKVIYVDPDVVVQADIVDMWDGHLQDRKCVQSLTIESCQSVFCESVIKTSVIKTS